MCDPSITPKFTEPNFATGWSQLKDGVFWFNLGGFGTMMNNFGAAANGHWNAANFYAGMRDKAKWPKAVAWAFGLITSFTMMCSIGGRIAFYNAEPDPIAEDTIVVDQILIILDHSPFYKNFATVLLVFIAINVAAGIPLTMIAFRGTTAEIAGWFSPEWERKMNEESVPRLVFTIGR